MPQQHDLFDDIIDISKGLDMFRDPLGSLTDALTGTTPVEVSEWNPADYKEKPRANTVFCLACRNGGGECSVCADICPVDAIEIEDGGIDIKDSCRKCGLCVAACPVEALSSPRIQPKKLYDAVAGAAAAHETAYVTCTRALKRPPRENEVLIACVGAVPREVWFSIMADYPNVSVYLPLDICTACKNAAGEEMLGDAIAVAEEWAASGLGLEVERRALKCTKRREYERKEFIDNVKRSTGLAVSSLNPAAAAIMSVSQKLKEHSQQITKLEKTLSAACGTTTQKHRRILTQRRKLVLSALQEHPELAGNVRVQRPECDFAACTMCGECVSACPVHANDLVGTGRFTVEPTYCIGCGACVAACSDHALKLVELDGADLVVPDPEAERRAAEAAKAHAEAEKMKAEAKRTLERALDRVEKLAD